jgi:hypothetical protein
MVLQKARGSPVKSSPAIDMTAASRCLFGLRASAVRVLNGGFESRATDRMKLGQTTI